MPIKKKTASKKVASKVSSEELVVSNTHPLGKEIAALVVRRDKIRKLDAQVTTLKAEQAEHEQVVRKMLIANGTLSSRGTKGTVTATEREVANIEDYKRFEAWIYKNKALDLLQNRVSITAVRERLSAKQKIAGISIKKIPTLSLTASK